MPDYLSRQISKLLRNKIIRFFLVSGINTAFGYGLFSFLVFIGLHYAIAGLIGTILGILFNFKTTGLLVFGSNKNGLIIKFIGVYGINYVISMSLLTLLERSGLDSFLSLSLLQVADVSLLKNPRINACIGAAILIIPMGLFAYTLNHRFVFTKPKLFPAQDIKES
jgi:putative flippase GtrA